MKILIFEILLSNFEIPNFFCGAKTTKKTELRSCVSKFSEHCEWRLALCELSFQMSHLYESFLALMLKLLQRLSRHEVMIRKERELKNDHEDPKYVRLLVSQNGILGP